MIPGQRGQRLLQRAQRSRLEVRLLALQRACSQPSPLEPLPIGFFCQLVKETCWPARTSLSMRLSCQAALACMIGTLFMPDVPKFARSWLTFPFQMAHTVATARPCEVCQVQRTPNSAAMTASGDARAAPLAAASAPSASSTLSLPSHSRPGSSCRHAAHARSACTSVHGRQPACNTESRLYGFEVG